MLEVVEGFVASLTFFRASAAIAGASGLVTTVTAVHLRTFSGAFTRGHADLPEY